MNIALLTNTFTPHVGGVARSVQSFARAYRELGHQVLVVAPEFDDAPAEESDVFRIPAIQHFNGSDFSVVLPVPSGLSDKMEAFKPDIIHSQHPFLLGMTAIRIARTLDLPLVFTHHTLYEHYTHYVPGDSPTMKRFVIELSTRYANLAHQVFAPSESIRDILIERGVTTPVLVVPTGVCVERFAQGNGSSFRLKRHIPEDAFVIGHMGRLAPEKNLEFLARSVVTFMKEQDRAVFLLVGAGPSQQAIERIFAEAGMGDRFYLCGVLENNELADALNAMSVFAFASKSETQGMVLTEAMAAGLPVVALDASGVREVVVDGSNGRLIGEETEEGFAEALQWVFSRSSDEMRTLIAAVRATAEDFSMAASAGKALAAYENLLPDGGMRQHEDELIWDQLRARIKAEWDIIKTVAQAGDEALIESFLASGQEAEQ
jgi:1,2-diacylglycerol 3-alpha-glucosyltransferase